MQPNCKSTIICSSVIKKSPPSLLPVPLFQCRAKSHQKRFSPASTCALSPIYTLYMSMDESRRAKTMPLAMERRRGIFYCILPPSLRLTNAGFYDRRLRYAAKEGTRIPCLNFSCKVSFAENRLTDKYSTYRTATTVPSTFRNVNNIC